MKEEEIDNTRMAAILAGQRKREQKLRPLRISPTVVILVPKEKCNEKYAEEYRKRTNRFL